MQTCGSPCRPLTKKGKLEEMRNAIDCRPSSTGAPYADSLASFAKMSAGGTWLVTNTNELIVRFKRGVSEEDARTLVARVGGRVRRRMRTDAADEVLLLVRVDAGDVAELASRIRVDASVADTEVNQGGFGPRG